MLLNQTQTKVNSYFKRVSTAVHQARKIIEFAKLDEEIAERLERERLVEERRQTYFQAQLSEIKQREHTT